MKYLFLVFAVSLFAACSSQRNAEFSARALSSSSNPALLDPPIITSATYQHTLYNGRSQSIDARAAHENAPLAVTYYRSEADYDADRNGFAEAPAETGRYFARIRRPEGNGYRQGRDIKVEYRIQKPLPPPEAQH